MTFLTVLHRSSVCELGMLLLCTLPSLLTSRLPPISNMNREPRDVRRHARQAPRAKACLALSPLWAVVLTHRPCNRAASSFRWIQGCHFSPYGRLPRCSRIRGSPSRARSWVHWSLRGHIFRLLPAPCNYPVPLYTLVVDILSCLDVNLVQFSTSVSIIASCSSMGALMLPCAFLSSQPVCNFCLFRHRTCPRSNRRGWSPRCNP